MNMLRLGKAIPTTLVIIAASAGLTACGVDVTQARVQSDVSTTFGHIYNDSKSLIGKPSTALDPSSACTHNGGTKNVGSGGWVCMITYADSHTHAKTTDKYSVNVDNTDCYVATNGLLAQTPNITTAVGKQVVNPLYQFDGCINPYS
jgi:hypothetical protein